MAYRLLAGAAVSALLLAGTANADDWHRGYGRGHDRGWDNDWDRGHGYRHHDDDGEEAALLIGGALLGLVVGSALADSDGGSSYSYGSYGGYSSPSYGYGYDSYGYGQPSYGYSQPTYGYGGYAPAPYTPAPTYSYATPSYGAAPTYVGGTNCSQARTGRTATGAVVGAVVGGLLGSGVSGNGAREEGTAVGAVTGALLGGSIGNSTAKCDQGGYYQTGGLVGGPLGQPAPAYPSYPSQPEYYPYEDELYGGPGYESSGPAAEECERVMQVTQLPDGREIHEPVTVCRQAYYGDWNVED
jgi:hypothetical protein